MGEKRHAYDEKELQNKAVMGYKRLFLMISIFAFICCFRTYILDRVIVSGSSMSPNYSDGDVIWAKKFGIIELSRYQVVVANIKGQLVIKRVIGLPGEALQIIDGKVYINGIELEDDYGYLTKKYGCATNEILLGEKEYFLMGDNRDESLDSRTWGAVCIENIKGVAVLRFFPFWKLIL